MATKNALPLQSHASGAVEFFGVFAHQAPSTGTCYRTNSKWLTCAMSECSLLSRSYVRTKKYSERQSTYNSDQERTSRTYVKAGTGVRQLITCTSKYIHTRYAFRDTTMYWNTLRDNGLAVVYLQASKYAFRDKSLCRGVPAILGRCCSCPTPWRSRSCARGQARREFAPSRGSGVLAGVSAREHMMSRPQRQIITT